MNNLNIIYFLTGVIVGVVPSGFVALALNGARIKAAEERDYLRQAKPRRDSKGRFIKRA